MWKDNVHEKSFIFFFSRLFERIEDVSSPENQAKVEVSYMEIYNEKVRMKSLKVY